MALSLLWNVYEWWIACGDARESKGVVLVPKKKKNASFVRIFYVYLRGVHIVISTNLSILMSDPFILGVVWYVMTFFSRQVRVVRGNQFFYFSIWCFCIRTYIFIIEVVAAQQQLDKKHSCRTLCICERGMNFNVTHLFCASTRGI